MHAYMLNCFVLAKHWIASQYSRCGICFSPEAAATNHEDRVSVAQTPLETTTPWPDHCTKHQCVAVLRPAISPRFWGATQCLWMLRVFYTIVRQTPITPGTWYNIINIPWDSFVFRACCSILQLMLYLAKVACCVKYVTINWASDASVTTAQKTISSCSCPYNTVAVACVSSILAVACVNYFTVLSMDIYLALSGIYYDFTHPPEDITTNKYNRRLASLKHSVWCRVASLNTGYYISRI